MLSIKVIGSRREEIGYYAELDEDYYSDAGKAPGQWLGKGAKKLGLTGEITRNAFQNILSGLGENGELPLVQNALSESRRAGFDLTFSVPKSVSIARAVGGEELASLIDVASERAVHASIELIQELCGFSRRGVGGQLIERSNMVFGVFRHETARGVDGGLPDPNIHYHTILCNVAVRPDGSSGALDARHLFRRQMKMAIGSLFRAELAKELESVGFSTYRPTGRHGVVSWFEVQGVSAEAIEAFSKRRKQIVGWLEKTGQSGAIASERAALQTREAKVHFSRTTLRNAWRDIGRRLGLSANSILRGERKPQAPISSGEVEAMMGKAIDSAARDRGHFTEIDLLRYAAEEGQSTLVGSKRILSAVRETLQGSPEIVKLRAIRGEQRYTTKAIVEVEKRLFELVDTSVGFDQHVVPNRILVKMLASEKSISDEQAEAVRHITGQLGRIKCVNGMAGTGKTFMLGVARKAWVEAGFDVLGVTLSARAAQGLEAGSKIKSTHLHRLFHELETGRRELSGQTILVLDEAGMVGTEMMEKLAAITAASRSKLVLVGDHRQLQAIEHGAPFRGISERVGVAEMNEIIRQRERWSRLTVSQFAEGKAAPALSEYAKRGLLRVCKDRDTAIQQLVDDWILENQSVADNQIFAGSRLESFNVNRSCQRALLNAGLLSDESVSLKSHCFHIGDKVLITRNNASLLVKNGTIGVVVGLNTSSEQLRVKIESGLTVSLDLAAFPHVELGYCITTHKGQGQTVESSFVLIGGTMTDRELSYVQASRARGTTRLYADEQSSGKEIRHLAERMSRSRAKDLVYEYMIEAA